LREKLDRTWRKKLEDRDRDHNQRLEEIDGEFAELSQRHSEEIRRERERIEIKVRQFARQDIEMELKQ